ncbi:MAG: hypothetical protein JXM69_07160 [Anaerolineae bacterium]|nr:hypothetical protein [Anaerolineae bacterium]
MRPPSLYYRIAIVITLVAVGLPQSTPIFVRNVQTSGPIIFTKYAMDGIFNGAISGYAADVNDDGDGDIPGAAYDSDDTIWWEQVELPSSQVVIQGTASVTFQDIFNDFDTTEVPIVGAPVFLVRNGRVVTTITTQAGGDYQFSLEKPNTGDNYRIRVELKDNNHIPAFFQVRYAAMANAPVVYAETKDFKLSTIHPVYVKSVNFSSDDVLMDPNIPLSRLTDTAVIYYHMRQVVDFIISPSPHGLGATLDYLLPVDVYSFDDGGDAYYQSSDSSIHIGGDNQVSDFSSGDRPMNREWHEMFHHLMQDTIEIPSGLIGNCNQPDYPNSYSADSWPEGWAEAWSAILQEQLGYPDAKNPFTYHFGLFSEVSLEQNYRVWHNFGTQRAFICENKTGSWEEFTEEFAVASLIWDLHDRAIDANGLYEDHLNLSTQNLWNALTSQTANSLNNVRELYQSLQVQGIGSSDSNGNGISDLDEVFIMHGFYADNGDYIYQASEEVGW